jgi:DNA-binding transcriptional MerR regulator
MKERRYTIQELSELTGFSIRTIRYYVHEGLIDPPAGRGRGGFYFDSQLNQLKQIKALQEKGMRLSSIVQGRLGQV